jgi:carbon storage regulator
MLVLSRKLNEEIVIAGEIRIRVLELRRGRVRLGVSAPADVTVDRAEISLRNCFSDGAGGSFGAGGRELTLHAG